MNWFKIIFSATLGIVFVVATVTALFGAVQATGAVMQTFIFQVDDQDYYSAPRPVVVKEDGSVLEEQPQETKEEIRARAVNQAKREIAQGLSMFIIAAPLAGVTFWQLRRMMREK